jgi:hypothetical protein
MGRLWHSLAATIVALASLALAFPAHAQSPKLEAAYVVLGPQGAVARAVLPEGSPCPAITIDGAQRPMSVRAQPDAMFRVLVCETLIPPTAAAASLADRPLPLPKRTLASIAVSAPFREVTFCASYKCHCFGVKGSRLSWFRG